MKSKNLLSERRDFYWCIRRSPCNRWEQMMQMSDCQSLLSSWGQKALAASRIPGLARSPLNLVFRNR